MSQGHCELSTNACKVINKTVEVLEKSDRDLSLILIEGLIKNLQDLVIESKNFNDLDATIDSVLLEDFKIIENVNDEVNDDKFIECFKKPRLLSDLQLEDKTYIRKVGKNNSVSYRLSKKDFSKELLKELVLEFDRITKLLDDNLKDVTLDTDNHSLFFNDPRSLLIKIHVSTGTLQSFNQSHAEKVINRLGFQIKAE